MVNLSEHGRQRASALQNISHCFRNTSFLMNLDNLFDKNYDLVAELFPYIWRRVTIFQMIHLL